MPTNDLARQIIEFAQVLAEKSPQEKAIAEVVYVFAEAVGITPPPPPPPEEPPNDSAYWYDPDPAHGGTVWQRRDGWLQLGSKFPYKWAEVCEYTDPTKWVRLVPDPAVDAPALPWTSPSCNSDYPDLKVERASDAGDVLEINGTRLSANRIRDLMGICARMLKPGAERDVLQAAAYAREAGR